MPKVLFENSEKLNAILNDKRNSRKFYQEEYSRLVTESTTLQESVQRAKIEYEKSVDGYKVAYSKYEELTSNPKSKGTSKKSEEVIKEKFQRAVKRLHIAHNDYVLHLLESADYERDFRTVLLPGRICFHVWFLKTNIAPICRNRFARISAGGARRHFTSVPYNHSGDIAIFRLKFWTI